MKVWGVSFCFCSFVLCVCGSLSACSIPNLESPTCGGARDAVKEFYSFHFGNDMHPTEENIKQRQRFLTPEFYQRVTTTGDEKTDVFTASEEPPKTFKVGKCEERGDDKAELQVQVYWRSDEKTVQKEVEVETVKSGDKWLISNVSNK